MKKNKNLNQYLKKRNRDLFFTQSKIQGYRSRSAFKLLEMNNKFKILKNDSKILDLGSFPGGWSQVASKIIDEGKILAVDIKPMEEIKNVDFINGDFFDDEIHKRISDYFKNKADIVLSDMAANTSGNKDMDSFRTGELCMKSMELAKKILIRDGVFLSKIFMGSIFSEIDDKANKYFKKVIKHKPLSSKKESKEIYIYCKGVLKI